MAGRIALVVCAALIFGCLLPPADANRLASGRGDVACFSVHETFQVGEVFSDEHCRRVKCISYRGQGYITEIERCPLPDIPETADCTMTEATDEKFPLCCPKAVCENV